MVTKKSKRMLLSLTPELHGILFRFSKAIDRPAATIVTDLLEQVAPNFEKCAEACEQAKENNFDGANNLLNALSEDLQDKFEKQ